jgi:hypothetical protein
MLSTRSEVVCSEPRVHVWYPLGNARAYVVPVVYAESTSRVGGGSWRISGEQYRNARMWGGRIDAPGYNFVHNGYSHRRAASVMCCGIKVKASCNTGQGVGASESGALITSTVISRINI